MKKLIEEMKSIKEQARRRIDGFVKMKDYSGAAVQRGEVSGLFQAIHIVEKYAEDIRAPDEVRSADRGYNLSEPPNPPPNECCADKAVETPKPAKYIVGGIVEGLKKTFNPKNGEYTFTAEIESEEVRDYLGLSSIHLYGEAITFRAGDEVTITIEKKE